jgi:hypothetical protein
MLMNPLIASEKHNRLRMVRRLDGLADFFFPTCKGWSAAEILLVDRHPFRIRYRI